MEINNNKETLSGAALVLGICVIVSTLVGAYTFYRVRAMDNTLAVTGSAKKAVVSDSVKWVATFNRIVDLANLKTGYSQIDTDLIKVKKFYTENGLSEKDLEVSPVFMEEVYSPERTGQNKQYMLRRTVTLQSNNVEKISSIAKNSQSLIGEGVVFSTQSLEYYYSKLPELRVSLLSSALKDAKARATEIAKSGDNKVGALKSASSGVVQVLAPNSVEIADYGNYDTGSINKDVMVTVKASFYLK